MQQLVEADSNLCISDKQTNVDLFGDLDCPGIMGGDKYPCSSHVKMSVKAWLQTACNVWEWV